MTANQLLDIALTAERRMHLFSSECQALIGVPWAEADYRHALAEVRASMAEIEQAFSLACATEWVANGNV